MAVVCEQKIGDTIVRIHDDAYKDITQEEVNRILKRIAEEVFPALTASASAREEEVS